MRIARYPTRKGVTSSCISVSLSVHASFQLSQHGFVVERTLGGLDVFLPYIHDYVNTFTGKSITTEQWKAHLYAYFERNGGSEKVKALDSVDWNVRDFASIRCRGHSLTICVHRLGSTEKVSNFQSKWNMTLHWQTAHIN